jgi:hypothetical protein
MVQVYEDILIADVENSRHYGASKIKWAKQQMYKHSQRDNITLGYNLYRIQQS